VRLVLADLLFAGRAGVFDITEGIYATWYAGATPETCEAEHPGNDPRHDTGLLVHGCPDAALAFGAGHLLRIRAERNRLADILNDHRRLLLLLLLLLLQLLLRVRRT